MRKQIILILAIIIEATAFPQSQNPPDILWNCINSGHFKIIFPAEIENQAQRVANTLEWSYINSTKSLNIKPKPVPVILNNTKSFSNASAALSPRRMEWYLFPSQSVSEMGSVEWTQTLSIHEFRHIVQYAKNRQHFTRFMSVLYGDLGQGMMRWTVPDWFFEGDAVAMETALTKGGRGRMPEFSMNIRTFALQNEKYTYDQAYFGSYKRYYPSHYHLGYPLISYGRVQFGSDIWDRVLERTSKISFWPYAFGGSLKKYTGLNNNKLYKVTMLDLQQKWDKQLKETSITEVKILNTKKKRCLTNYFNPKYDLDGNMICGKETLSRIPALYLISPDGEEKKIINTDAEVFNIENNKIIWSRSIPDIRWGEQSFSDIIIYDIKNSKEKRLTIKKKYLSPSLSPDGKTIAVVEFSPDQQCRLCLLDASTGKEIKSYQLGENDYIRMPAWSKDGKMLTFTHAKFKGSALSILELANDKITKILDYNFENINRPLFYKKYILYNSSFSGISNIYAVDIETGQKYQVTSRPYGACNADISADETKMIFQDYNKNGYDIAEMELNPEYWTKIEAIKPFELPYYKTLVEQEGNQSIDSTQIQEKKYPVEKYRKFRDGIKIHSWGLFPYVPDLEFSVYSNNYLNTLGIQAGYVYNTNEKTNTGYLGFSYSRFFPVFTVISSYGQRNELLLIDDLLYKDEWQEFNTNATISLPFNISRNVYSTNLNFKAGVNYKFSQDKVERNFDEPNGNFLVLLTGLTFNNSMQYAWRDFNPKWAQYLSVDFKQIPKSGKRDGYLFSARTSLFFPGILPQNSLKLSGAYEQQIKYDELKKDVLYYFSGLYSFPRGFTAYTFDKFYKFSADYQFPLWYPDISIGPLAYVKRIRAGLFYDYGKGYLNAGNRTYQSFGGSLICEFYLLRVRYPFEVGIQYAYKPKYPAGEKQHAISLLIFGLPF